MPSDRPSAPAVFVVGTDTGVGKTHVSCALLRGAVAKGLRAVGMKPVAAGATPVPGTSTWVCEDAAALRAASNVPVAAELDNPVLLPEPLSPHLAARRAGTEISLAPIVTAFHALRGQADVVVVEGAGGFMVPLYEPTAGTLLTGADLARALDVPLILVVGLRLGCLNHSLLTIEAIRSRGLRLRGWVANRIDPEMDLIEDNIALLRRHIGAPLLADVAHGECAPVIDGWWARP